MGALVGEFRGGCDFWISIPAGNCTALSGGARRRRHGPGRCEIDGPDRRSPGYVADAVGAGAGIVHFYLRLSIGVCADSQDAAADHGRDVSGRTASGGKFGLWLRRLQRRDPAASRKRKGSPTAFGSGATTLYLIRNYPRGRA